LRALPEGGALPYRIIAVKRIVRALLALVVAGAALVVTPWGAETRERFATNRACCDLTITQALRATIDELVLGRRYPSQIGQDKWILFKVHPGVTDGFFLDVGSADGTLHSNTKALEERGWTGLCIDPFPTNMDGRTCRIFTEVVWSTSGHTVTFHPHGLLGGVADTLDTYKDLVSQTKAVEFSTVTLAEVLQRAQAPAYIHFMSLDIEGAELEALLGLPLERYRFGAIAIEHNGEEPKRSHIVRFLAQRGYQRTFTRMQDDFFEPVRGVR